MYVSGTRTNWNQPPETTTPYPSRRTAVILTLRWRSVKRMSVRTLLGGLGGSRALCEVSARAMVVSARAEDVACTCSMRLANLK